MEVDHLHNNLSCVQLNPVDRFLSGHNRNPQYISHSKCIWEPTEFGVVFRIEEKHDTFRFDNTDTANLNDPLLLAAWKRRWHTGLPRLS